MGAEVTSTRAPLVYAIGDTHGEIECLASLLEKIAEHGAAQADRQRILVYLGDYVDRGPDSAGVIARVRAGLDGFVTVALRGNHEQMMLDAFENRYEDAVDLWIQNGGYATLESYGLKPSALKGSQGAVPEQFISDCAWIAELPFSASIPTADGDLFFVHAGVRPFVPLQDQELDDLIWIREAFLNFTGSFGARIVHGHTPYGPEIRANRVNLDAGAYRRGVLFAGVFDCAHPARVAPELISAGTLRR